MKIDEVEYEGIKFKYREGTTDWGIIQSACGGLNIKFFDVASGEIWYDFGAHIGSFSVYAALKGALVFAFEPIPDNILLLEENTVLNEVDREVVVVPYAVLEKETELDIYFDPINYGHCGKYDDKGLDTIKVKSIAVSSIKFPSQFCVKLDVEGSEMEILNGLELERVQKLVMEFHYWFPHLKSIDIKQYLRESFPNVEQEKKYMFYAWR